MFSAGQWFTNSACEFAARVTTDGHRETHPAAGYRKPIAVMLRMQEDPGKIRFLQNGPDRHSLTM